MLNIDFPVFWTATNTLLQGAATILAIVALIYSVHTFRKSVLLTHFAVLDELYADLLKLGIEKPHLRTPNAVRTPEQEEEYNFYAHLAWCFVESVYDRGLLDKKILHTWISAVEIETRLHRAWLERPENAYMFKEEFHKYIAATFPRQQSVAAPIRDREQMNE